MTPAAIRSGVLLLLLAAPAFAQRDPSTRRLELEVGGGLVGGTSLGAADANLRANATTRQASTLFATTSRMAATPSAHARVGFALSRRLSVEGGAVVGHPRIHTSVSGDVEGAPALTVEERIDQYFVEGSVLVHFDEIRFGGRTVPFLAAGAGYLRQLHEGLTVIEQGHLYHLGGGVKHWLLARDRGLIKAAGLRAEGRLYLLKSGISFNGNPRPHLAASGGVFVAF